ncbi:MAG: hypothetical protein CL570_08480 [Alphaproteobacteria bacterium]|nr:hypothetical protein [Alphaproteobacteria bacterium]
MNILKGVLIMGLLTFLSGCAGGPKVNDYQATQPPLDLRSYFTGPIKAWGLVQDYTGKVTRRFDVEMIGTWKGDTGTLKEKFVYYDGETQERTWTIKQIAASQYEGSAGDIIGTATGHTAGNAMRWAYAMDLDVGEKTYRITFDDWMFLMNDGVLINRSYLKKFGLTVGELTLFMQKQDDNE